MRTAAANATSRSSRPSSSLFFLLHLSSSFFVLRRCFSSSSSSSFPCCAPTRVRAHRAGVDSWTVLVFFFCFFFFLRCCLPSSFFVRCASARARAHRAGVLLPPSSDSRFVDRTRIFLFLPALRLRRSFFAAHRAPRTDGVQAAGVGHTRSAAMADARRPRAHALCAAGGPAYTLAGIQCSSWARSSSRNFPPPGHSGVSAFWRRDGAEAPFPHFTHCRRWFPPLVVPRRGAEGFLAGAVGWPRPAVPVAAAQRGSAVGCAGATRLWGAPKARADAPARVCTARRGGGLATPSPPWLLTGNVACVEAPYRGAPASVRRWCLASPGEHLPARASYPPVLM